VPWLYLAVKLSGAAYLVWLGIGIFRGAGRSSELPVIEPKSARRAFADSLLIEVLNPKTAIFFVAFLPQFVDPAAGLPVAAQFAILGTIANAMFSLADIACVLLADLVVSRLRGSGRAGRLVRRLSGGLMIGLGLRLALEPA